MLQKDRYPQVPIYAVAKPEIAHRRREPVAMLTKLAPDQINRSE